MPGLQSFSDTVISCFNDGGVIKVNAMIIRPRIVRNVKAFGARFHICDVFLFSSDERFASFTYVIPGTGSANVYVTKTVDAPYLFMAYKATFCQDR